VEDCFGHPSLPSTLEKVAEGQTNCPDGSRRKTPALLRGAGSTACEQMAAVKQAAFGLQSDDSRGKFSIAF